MLFKSRSTNTLLLDWNSLIGFAHPEKFFKLIIRQQKIIHEIFFVCTTNLLLFQRFVQVNSKMECPSLLCLLKQYSSPFNLYLFLHLFQLKTNVLRLFYFFRFGTFRYHNNLLVKNIVIQPKISSRGGNPQSIYQIY